MDQICERIPAESKSLEERRDELLVSLRDPETGKESWESLCDVLKSEGDRDLADFIASTYIGKVLKHVCNYYTRLNVTTTKKQPQKTLIVLNSFCHF